MTRYECPICGRAFSTGRSLGGHMSRGHRSTPSAPAASDATAIPQAPMLAVMLERYRCEECGKEFQTQKAVYGHMRVHSREREDPNERKKNKKRKVECEDEDIWVGLPNDFGDQERIAVMGLEMLRKQKEEAAAASLDTTAYYLGGDPGGDGDEFRDTAQSGNKAGKKPVPGN